MYEGRGGGFVTIRDGDGLLRKPRLCITTAAADGAWRFAQQTFRANQRRRKARRGRRNGAAAIGICPGHSKCGHYFRCQPSHTQYNKRRRAIVKLGSTFKFGVSVFCNPKPLAPKVPPFSPGGLYSAPIWSRLGVAVGALYHSGGGAGPGGWNWTRRSAGPGHARLSATKPKFGHTRRSICYKMGFCR